MPAALFLTPLHSSNAPHSSPRGPNPSSNLRNAHLSSPSTYISSFKLRFPNHLLQSSHTPRASQFESQEKNHNLFFSGNPLSHNTGVKMPTAPWMRGPLLVPTEEVLDLTKNRMKKYTKEGEGEGENLEHRSLTKKVRGGRSRQAMKKIVESVTKLQEIDGAKDEEFLHRAEESEFRVPIEQIGEEEERRPSDLKMPWARAEKIVFRRTKKEKVVTAAELSLTESVLARLRSDAAEMTKWVKAKKAGVTEEVVNEIKRAWRKSELAMVKFDVPLRRYMDRAREIIETKTGGLVVWSKNDALVVYRGCNYQSPSNILSHLHSSLAMGRETSPSKVIHGKSECDVAPGQVEFDAPILDGMMTMTDVKVNSFTTGMVVEGIEGVRPITGTLYEREANRLLDGLGPRFIDWWWPKPLPVDADLLPEVVPDFRPPFRLCPPHVRPKLTDAELTYLRKLARPLPTHFALGKNTKLQGLASAIIKLWEKSVIAKIAVKYGIPNTNNEQMSCELKRLTGGVLILRNKFFIIFYRGKDFLPCTVANLIAEREADLKNQQLHEEGARSKAIELFHVNATWPSSSKIGTYSEFQDIQTKSGHQKNGNWEIEVQVEAEKMRLEKELKKQEHQLSILKLKIGRSERELAELNSAWRPQEQAADQEMLTEEERQTFRKIALKMDETLLLGRRGIYAGVIGSIHQHWKHREIVKVITMQRVLSQIVDTAKLLEIESGGILVAIEKLIRGHAIIIYRGKNYSRPLKLLPENLLPKRAAFQRSMEMQRRGSLKYFAYQRQRAIWALKLKLRGLQESDGNLVQRESRCL